MSDRASAFRRLVRRLRAQGGAAALCVLLAACGSGGDGGADPGAGTPPVAPPPAAPVGDPVSATVGAAGGSVDFTASGVAGSLSFPAGALASATAITVTPVAPAEGEWARLEVSGLDGVLEQPATLTLTLPAGSTLDPAAAVTQTVTEGDALLPATLDPAARKMTVAVQRFGRGGEVKAALAAGGRATPRAVPPGNPGTLILNQRLLVQLRVITAEARFRELQRFGDFSSTLELSMSIAALLQSSGLDGWEAQARPWLDRAGASACENLRLAIERALSTPAPTDLDPEGRVPNAYVTRISAPVLYWSSIADRLGVSCVGLDPRAAIRQAHERVLTLVAAKLRARQDLPTIRGAVGEAAAAKSLHQQGNALGAVGRVAPRASDRPHALGASLASEGDRRRLDASTNPVTLGAQVRDEVMVPALEPLRVAHWGAGTTEATQDHYRYSLAVYGAASPLADDLQMVRTSLQVASAAGTEALGTGRGGAGTTPNDTVKEITVPARRGGRVDLNGPIDVLHCPNAASERLVIDFEGATVLDRAAAGATLLDAAQRLDVDALLTAANIDPATRGTHTLTLRRVGSACNPVLGLADAVLMRVRLDFLAGEPPPPSQITGRVFRGTMLHYYMPYDNPECSRTCLDRNPGSDRCPVNGHYDASLVVSGDPRSYRVDLTTKHSDSPPDQPPNEDVFAGSGGPFSFGGSWSSGRYLQGSTMGFSVSDVDDSLRGAITYRCHRIEMELQGPGRR